MSTITHYAYGLMNGSLLAELPVNAPTWTRKLNSAGTYSATLDLADPTVRKKTWATATRGARTLWVVDVDGAIQWAGILWDPKYDSSTRKFSLSASEAWSYFGRRVQARDYTTPPLTGPGHAYWSANPAASYDVAAALVADAIAQAGSALSTLAIDIQATGTPSKITESYPITQKQTIDSLISQINVAGYGTGFDFTIEWAWSGGQGSTPVPTLVLNFPRAGRIAGKTGVVVDAGQAGAAGYTWPIAGSQAANKIHGMASGTGSLLAVVTDPTPLDDGWPLLEEVQSFQAVNTITALTTATRGILAIKEWPVTTPTVTVPMFGSVALGDFALGDTLRLIIPPDERFPKGLDTYMRVTALTCTPGDEGTPLMTFTFESAPGLAPVPPPPGV